MNFKIKRQRGNCFSVTLAAALLLASPGAYGADSAPEVTPVALPVLSSTSVVAELSAEAIVGRLAQRNQERAAALRGFEGKRTYQLTYQGFPSGKEAQMEVAAHYQAPESKSFDVLSQSGSNMVQNKVFAKLLEGEQEAARPENQRETALTTDNYTFTLLGSRPSAYGGCYRLGVAPKRNNKFLYRGEICVNAADYAVESIDAEPARNPSFWIKKTRIEHRYQKVGEFWLPASNKSISHVRLGGTATLSILYTGYELR